LRAQAVRGTCLLFTDASSPLSDEELGQVLALFGVAEVVLFDALRFGARRVARDVPAFVERVAAASGVPVEPVLDLGDDGKYFLVDNRGRTPARPWWRRLFG